MNDKVKTKNTTGSSSSDDPARLKIRLRDLWWYIAIMAIFTVFVAYRLISPGMKIGFDQPAGDMTVADYGFDLSNLSVDKSVVVPSGFKTDGKRLLTRLISKVRMLLQLRKNSAARNTRSLS